jgi:hypothetical protein
MKSCGIYSITGEFRTFKAGFKTEIVPAAQIASDGKPPYRRPEETAMYMKPTLPRPRPITSFVAATLASVIAIGILAAVTDLFQRSGAPMERLVAAERACVSRSYVSEREACMRERLAASRLLSMANR